MALDKSTFDYLQPNAQQIEDMKTVREAAAAYTKIIEAVVPEGPDRTYLLRHIREAAMWANVAITRNVDGSPRQ